LLYEELKYRFDVLKIFFQGFFIVALRLHKCRANV
jgi:hypothetical protein